MFIREPSKGVRGVLSSKGVSSRLEDNKSVLKSVLIRESSKGVSSRPEDNKSVLRNVLDIVDRGYQVPYFESGSVIAVYIGKKDGKPYFKSAFEGLMLSGGDPDMEDKLPMCGYGYESVIELLADRPGSRYGWSFVKEYAERSGYTGDDQYEYVLGNLKLVEFQVMYDSAKVPELLDKIMKIDSVGSLLDAIGDTVEKYLFVEDGSIYTVKDYKFDVRDFMTG